MNGLIIGPTSYKMDHFDILTVTSHSDQPKGVLRSLSCIVQKILTIGVKNSIVVIEDLHNRFQKTMVSQGQRPRGVAFSAYMKRIIAFPSKTKWWAFMVCFWSILANQILCGEKSGVLIYSILSSHTLTDVMVLFIINEKAKP